MNLKKNGKVFTGKFVGTGPPSYEKRIYRAAVSQRLRNTALHEYTQFIAVYCAFAWCSELSTKFSVHTRAPHHEYVWVG